MQSMNVQHHVLPMNEQFFTQGQPNEQNSGMSVNAPQMFSPQINHTRILQQQNQQNQQQQQQQIPQQPGILPNIQVMGNNQQDISNGYLMKQKVDSLVAQQQQVQNQQQLQGQQQPLAQGQTQQQQQQNFNIGNNNFPPGINVFEQPGISMTQPVINQIPNQMNINTNNGPILPMVLPPPNHLFIRDVWKNNLYSEFALIRQLVTKYNHVSISTEFVGTLARPIGTFRSKEDYHYQTMRSNVDFLNPVQLGISLSDANGNKPENGISTWQFNIEFDIAKEMVSAESMELLRKAGVNFDHHKNNGVSIFEFAQLMMDSGLLMDQNVTWITYHAAYDLGFLVNIFMNDAMPNNLKDFEWWVHKYFPSVYDLNLIYKIIRDFKHPQQVQPSQYTLSTLADEIGIPRFPIFTTTAGQSLLMLLSFCQLNKLSMHKFPNGTDFSKYKNVIYGINGE